MVKNNKIVKRISVLGLAALIGLTGMTLTGCSNKLKEAQNNIDYSVTAVLNEDEQLKQNYNNANFSDFTFLCSDVEKNENNKYDIDINGIVNINNDKTQKAYATLKYLVDGKYFDEMSNASQEEVINTLALIVQNENFKSVSIQKVNNIKDLNSSMSAVTESPLKDFSMDKNFLYGIGNISFDEENNVASFSTKEASKFSKTTVTTSYGIVGINSDGTPRMGLVTTTNTEYKTFFLEHNILLKLSPEEMEAAKNDNSIIFDKFTEYVKNKEKDKYVVQESNIENENEFSANMMDDVTLGK